MQELFRNHTISLLENFALCFRAGNQASISPVFTRFYSSRFLNPLSTSPKAGKCLSSPLVFTRLYRPLFIELMFLSQKAGKHAYVFRLFSRF